MSSQTGRRRWQFSLLTLLIAMSGVALMCLALRSPNEAWATAVFVAAAGSLALAALAAIYRDGRTRAFAIGFLVVGAAYWGLVLLAESNPEYGQPRLPTTRWTIALFTLLHQDSMNSTTVMTAVYSAPVSYQGPAYPPAPPPPIPAGSTAGSPVYPSTGPPVVSYVPQVIQRPLYAMQTFIDISHQSLVLLLGLLGGIVAQWLYATRREEPPPTAAPAG